MTFGSPYISVVLLLSLQPVGFVTFATKDDAEAAKLELQVFDVDFLPTFWTRKAGPKKLL